MGRRSKPSSPGRGGRRPSTAIGGQAFLTPLPGLAGFGPHPSAYALGYCLVPLTGLTAITRCSRYTELVLKRITIAVSEEAAHWARKKAAEENTSVSRLVGRMLEDQMRRTDEYWAAYEKFKRIKPIPGIDAAHRLTREEAHERRR